MTLTQINRAGLDAEALDRVFTIGASGSSAYTFQGEGLNGTVNNPTLYLTRGKTYRFENGSGGHPIRIQSTSGASGTAYNTGVTNNAGSGTVIVEVQHDAPDVLYYQCTSHAAMNGILYITGALADGGVTTAKIAADAVTTAKIADDAVTFAKMQNTANGARLLGKLSSGGGQIQEQTAAEVRSFLNVADGATNSPTTTINNNADNRVITGSGTANTLNGESNLTYNGTLLTAIGSNEADLFQLNTGNHGGNTFAGIRGDNEAGIRIRGGGSQRGGEIELGGGTRNTDPAVIKFSTTTGTSFDERMRLDSSGRLMINTTTLSQSKTPMLEVKSDSNSSTDFAGTFTSANGSSGIGISYGVIEAFNNTSNSIIQFKTNGADAVRIASNQNVGIGTTNPGQRLEVRQTSASHAIIACNRPNSDTFAVALGNNSSGEGVISVNNADLVFGKDFSGNFTERMRMRNDGGLCFNGDSAAANALDDYEEGGWTASLVSGGSSVTNDSNNNKYVKIGSMVFITGDVYGLSNPNGNTFEIGGLPYQIAQSREGTGSIMCNNVNFVGRTMASIYLYANQTKFRIYTSGNNTSWRATTGTDFSSSGNIIFSFAYQTTA